MIEDDNLDEYFTSAEELEYEIHLLNEEADQLVNSYLIIGNLKDLLNKYHNRMNDIYYLFGYIDFNQNLLEIYLSEMISVFEGFSHEVLKLFLKTEKSFKEIERITLNRPLSVIQIINKKLSLCIEKPNLKNYCLSDQRIKNLIRYRNKHIHCNSISIPMQNNKEFRDDIFNLEELYNVVIANISKELLEKNHPSKA